MKVRFGSVLVEIMYSDVPEGDSGSHMRIYFSKDAPEEMKEPTYQQILDEHIAYQTRNAPMYKELLKHVMDSWVGVPGEW